MSVSRSAKLSYITIITIVSVRYVCDSCSYSLGICRPGTFKLDLALLFCPRIFSFYPGNVLEIFCEICVDTLIQHFQVNKYLNFSIGPGLIAHWLSWFKTFTSIIFYYVGQMPSDKKWKKREKRNDKEHHEKASFFHKPEYSNGFCFVLFLRKRLLYFQCNLFMFKFKWDSEAAVPRCTSK